MIIAWMRLCFGHPTPEEIVEGVAKLARICHREFGVPTTGTIARLNRRIGKEKDHGTGGY